MSSLPGARRWAMIPCLFLFLTLVGCGGGNMVELRSAADPSRILVGNLGEGVYAYQSKNHMEFLMIDGPVENPSQIMHVRFFWQPLSGVTQLDPESINTEINYVIFAEGEVGIYGGGGLLTPGLFDEVGDESFGGLLEGVKLHLIDKSEGFVDQLGPVVMTGGVSARLDERELLARRTQLNILLEQSLKRPVFIHDDQAWQDILVLEKSKP